jgi:NAD(P)-dependent dehydrogenase (short-subunit alcohol dehydrogenase family)
MRLESRVAIVTGAGGGLGRAHALLLARYGAKVVVNDMDLAAATRVADEIVAARGEAIPVAASVTDEAAVATMIGGVMSNWGRVDILINNAGILRDKTFAKMTLDDFKTGVYVHHVGTANCTKAVWEIMRQQQYGRVVMTTSSSGLYGNFGQCNYGAAKLALVGLMQTLGLEGEKHNVRVNCLAPTAATQMTHGVLAEEALQRLAPKLVSPGLLALVGEQAPNRAILCAGAGHFALANITLTQGVQIGNDADAGERVIAQWQQIADRTEELVPAYGFKQAERELAAAGHVAGAMAER